MYYLSASLQEDADYQPPRIEDPEPLGEEEEVEEEEEHPLHIPDPSGTHLRIPPSEQNFEDFLRGEIENVTGQTPWNNNRPGVQIP